MANPRKRSGSQGQNDNYKSQIAAVAGSTGPVAAALHWIGAVDGATSLADRLGWSPMIDIAISHGWWAVPLGAAVWWRFWTKPVSRNALVFVSIAASLLMGFAIGYGAASDGYPGLASISTARPKRIYMISNGRDQRNPSIMTVTTEGAWFEDKAGQYRLAAMAVLGDGTTGIEDAAGLQKSPALDIRPGRLTLRMQADSGHMRQLTAGMRGTTYVLALVPATLRMESFSTIRQAQALGVIIVDTNSRPIG